MIATGHVDTYTEIIEWHFYRLYNIDELLLPGIWCDICVEILTILAYKIYFMVTWWMPKKSLFKENSHRFDIHLL